MIRKFYSTRADGTSLDIIKTESIYIGLINKETGEQYYPGIVVIPSDTPNIYEEVDIEEN